MGICLLGYKGEMLEKVKGWDGFVSPDGEFLKVSERGNMDTVHDEFAYVYVLNKFNKDLHKLYAEFQLINPQYQSINLGCKDIFINLLGYVNIEKVKDHVEIEIPNPSMYGHKVTNAQFDTLARLIKINGDNKEDLLQVFKYERGVGDYYQFTR